MKILLILIIFALTTLGCSNKQTPVAGKLMVAAGVDKTEIFKEVSDFPTIKDSSQFIDGLSQTFNLKVHESPVQKENEKITVFRKVRLNGSDKEYFFIEYDWKAGSMAEFPWKVQLLLTEDGKLVKTMAGLRFDFVSVFPDQNPFLLILTATAKGNGGHELYKIAGDTLENIYEGYYNYNLQTYDAHQDTDVFEPNELTIRFTDENSDGFNDFIFTGQKLMLGKYTKDNFWYDVENGKPFTIENPADRISIKYIFLFDKHTGHFKAKANY